MFRFNKHLSLLMLSLILCGCATITDRYRAVIFSDGISKREAITIAQYHLTQHPLARNFKNGPKNILNEKGNKWQIYFNPKGYFDYFFRVDIDEKSGHIIRSGLILQEKSQFEKILTNFFSFFTEGDLIVVSLVAQFYEENSRWPSNQEEIKAWMRKKGVESSKEDKKDDLVDPLSQVELLNPTTKQVELYLPPLSTENMYKEYLFDSKQLAKRKIIISRGHKPNAFKLRYPDLGDMVFPITINKTSIVPKEQ